MIPLAQQYLVCFLLPELDTCNQKESLVTSHPLYSSLVIPAERRSEGTDYLHKNVKIFAEILKDIL